MAVLHQHTNSRESPQSSYGLTFKLLLMSCTALRYRYKPELSRIAVSEVIVLW